MLYFMKMNLQEKKLNQSDTASLFAKEKSISFEPRILSIVLFIIAFAISVIMSFSFENSLQQDDRLRLLSFGTAFQSKLQNGLNSRLLLGKALAIHLQYNSSMSETDFTMYASELINSDDIIKNVALLEGTTVKYVFPYAANAKAIGSDLSLIPAQREAVLEAINTGMPIFQSSVKLVQGGVGLIYRIPIMLNVNGSKQYWGQLSIVIDQDKLLKESGLLDDNFSYNYAIYNFEHKYSQNPFVAGDEKLIHKNPIELPIVFTKGSWRLLLAPKSGWIVCHNFTIIIFILGIIIGIVLSTLLFFLAKSKESFKVLAYHDGLTGLANFSLFSLRFQQSIERVKNENTVIAVILLDLDGFKEINDTYGHAAGDSILKEAAKRLNTVVRASDTVARIGGDEFLILLADLVKEENIEPIILKIRTCFTEEYSVDGVSVPLGASLGYAFMPREADSGINLVHIADERMYKEKKMHHVDD